jgi:hypothetical protein
VKHRKDSDFPSRLPRLQSSVMALFRRFESGQLEQATSDLTARVQRLETERDLLHARLEGEHQLRMLTAHITAAAQAAPVIGAAIERFAEAMRSPVPVGRTDGLARAEAAWRQSDGTFMPEGERAVAIEEFQPAEYERYAAAGRARAGSAPRDAMGRFI